MKLNNMKPERNLNRVTAKLSQSYNPSLIECNVCNDTGRYTKLCMLYVKQEVWKQQLPKVTYYTAIIGILVRFTCPLFLPDYSGQAVVFYIHYELHASNDTMRLDVAIACKICQEIFVQIPWKCTHIYKVSVQVVLELQQFA